MMALNSLNTVRTGKGTNSTFKSWICNSEACSWELNINFSKRSKTWSMTKFNHVHSNCSSTFSLNIKSASNYLINKIGSSGKINSKNINSFFEKENILIRCPTQKHRIIKENESSYEESI